jgi:hypothetical protein
MDETETRRSPLLVALAGLVLPGLGYWLVGQRKRAIAVGSAILLLFLLGILVAGVRVIEVPGWGEDGRKLYYDVYRYRDNTGAIRVVYQPVSEPVIDVEVVGGTREHLRLRLTRRTIDGATREEMVSDAPSEPSRWALSMNPRGEVFNKIWFVPQVLMGLPALLAGWMSILAGAAGVAKSHARSFEIGTLMTTTAGMLNLLAVIAAASAADREERHV